VVAKFSLDPEAEEKARAIGVTVRCIPFEQSGTEGRCVVTGQPATTNVVFAKAY
jgi:prolyl-tRNA synthetase